MLDHPLTFGSLFAGIGGIDLGLERAGMVCKWQVEIDDYATRVLTKHWPSVPKYRDVRSVGAHNLPAVDLICGGFPCQDISAAGQRAGITGERSGLWTEYARIIRDLRPRYVLVENVSALLGRGLSTVLGDLAEIGYDAEWHCIPAAAVGAPHRRDRVFIVAYTPRLQLQEQPHTRANPSGYSGERIIQRQPPLLADASSRRYRTPQSEIRSGRNGIEHSDWWATEPSMGRVADGVPRRMDRLRGLGNAVVPQVAEFIGKLIMEHANA